MDKESVVVEKEMDKESGGWRRGRGRRSVRTVRTNSIREKRIATKACSLTHGSAIIPQSFVAIICTIICNTHLKLYVYTLNISFTTLQRIVFFPEPHNSSLNSVVYVYM